MEWSVSHGQDYIMPNRVLDDVRPAFDQPGPKYRMSSSNRKSRDEIGQSDVAYKLRHRNSDGPELNSFPKHQAIIVSSSPAGLSATGAKLLLEASVRIIGIRNGQTEKFVKFKWAIRPSLVVVDKFHEVKNLATTLATALRLIQRHAPKNQPPKIMPLSATPLTGTDMKKCLNLVTRLVLPEAWDHEPKGSPCYKLSHEDLIDRLVRGYQTLTAEMANASEPDLLERRNGVRKQLVERLRSIMTIRSGTDLFFGEQTILLPPLIKECASEDGVLVCQSLRAAAPDFAAKLNAQRRSAVLPATGSGHQGQPSASQDLYKMALDADFLWRLLLGNFPGIIDLPPDVQESIRSSSSAQSSPSDSLLWSEDADVRAMHPFGRHIDTICKSSGKIRELEKFLELALKDKEPPRAELVAGMAGATSDQDVVFKKHVVVFAARPISAALLAMWAHRNVESRWQVHLITARNDGDRARGQDQAAAAAPHFLRQRRQAYSDLHDAGRVRHGHERAGGGELGPHVRHTLQIAPDPPGPWPVQTVWAVVHGPFCHTRGG